MLDYNNVHDSFLILVHVLNITSRRLVGAVAVTLQNEVFFLGAISIISFYPNIL